MSAKEFVVGLIINGFWKGIRKITIFFRYTGKKTVFCHIKAFYGYIALIYCFTFQRLQETKTKNEENSKQ